MIVKEVKFFPRVGASYEYSRWGKRVMVLGESHYCADVRDATPDLTQRVFGYLFDPSCTHEGWMNTYTKFASALSGVQEDRFSSEAIWDEVLYYNYVQEPLSGPRTAPSCGMIRDSDGAFWAVLEEYRPDVILAWGRSRLYDNLPDGGYQGADCIGVETWIYELSNGHKIHILPVQHPASSFSPSEWCPIIKEFLDR